MIRRSKINILSVLVLSMGLLLLASGPAIAKFRGGKATSSPTVKTSGTTTKAAVAGAAGGVVGAAAARAAMRGSAPAGDVHDNPPGGTKDRSPSGASVAAVKPVAAEVVIFNYDPIGKPDPFKPFVEAELALRKRLEMEKKKKIPLSPLQRAGVESYTLLGIAGSQAKRSALVKDSAGKTYTLSLGTHIGLNNGKVVDIRSDRVVVEEPAVKKAKARKIEMKLRREGEEGRP